MLKVVEVGGGGPAPIDVEAEASCRNRRKGLGWGREDREGKEIHGTSISSTLL